MNSTHLYRLILFAIVIFLLIVASYGCKTKQNAIVSTRMFAVDSAFNSRLGNRTFLGTSSTGCDTCKFSAWAIQPVIRNPSWRIFGDAGVIEKMRITPLDSLKQMKVWFDPKYILFTSDSTFTILDKPKK